MLYNVTKSLDELKRDSQRLQTLIDADLQARETLKVLPEDVQEAYSEQLKLLSEAIGRASAL